MGYIPSLLIFLATAAVGVYFNIKAIHAETMKEAVKLILVLVFVVLLGSTVTSYTFCQADVEHEHCVNR